ncbi:MULTISPECIES: hypothetical protein [Halorussus]|uniref:hypothetical protein n=1 Tax=Halorussus TaxID=1070314 RepID=UPI00209E7569|nr:hypothetical protein [Halorussus vallis]USZ78122.1 hypothetical protein NGM07_20910 [Halorussus vallis]
MSSFTDADRELVEAATRAIEDRDERDRHRVGAAVRTETGDVFAGVDLRTPDESVGVCAESVALGTARLAGSGAVVAVAAVSYPRPNERREPEILVPCDSCRDLLVAYGDRPRAVVAGDDGPEATPIADLSDSPAERADGTDGPESPGRSVENG